MGSHQDKTTKRLSEKLADLAIDVQNSIAIAPHTLANLAVEVQNLEQSLRDARSEAFTEMGAAIRHTIDVAWLDRHDLPVPRDTMLVGVNAILSAVEKFEPKTTEKRLPIPVLDLQAEDMVAESARYAAAVAEWVEQEQRAEA